MGKRRSNSSNSNKAPKRKRYRTRNSLKSNKIELHNTSKHKKYRTRTSKYKKKERNTSKCKKNKFLEGIPKEYSSKSASDFLYKANLKEEGKYLFSQVNQKKWKNVEKDQMIRAEKIIDTMVEYKKDILYLMDGGRMIYCIYSILNKRGLKLNIFEIVLIDFNKDMVEHHKKVFPFLETINKDVTNFIPKNNELVYMNFCSLGSLAVEAERHIFNLCNYSNCCLISFAKRGGKSKKLATNLENKSKKQEIKETCNLGSRRIKHGSIKIQYVSNRMNFYTFKCYSSTLVV